MFASMVVVAISLTSVTVGAQAHRLQMWIAPLECTKSEIADGINTTVIIAPEECEEWLGPEDPHPEPNPGAKPDVKPRSGSKDKSSPRSKGTTDTIGGIAVPGIPTPSRDEQIEDDEKTNVVNPLVEQNMHTNDVALIFFVVISILFILLVRKWSKDAERDLQNKE